MSAYDLLDSGDKVPLEHSEIINEDKDERRFHFRDFGQRKYIHIGNKGPSGRPKSIGNSLPSSVSSPAGLSSAATTNGSSTRSPSSSSSSSSSWRNSLGLKSNGFNGINILKSPLGSKEQNIMKSLNKNWIHPPETLARGHIVYNVKFLGDCEVEQPKGTEIVRDAIRKMKFTRQVKKAEGQKPSKVELTVSIDGVTIQYPKTKVIMHQYPLHRISYCADDKSDKRMFTFIAKAADSSKHFCYVFDSDKCAEEITLTVGQAFDMAYRKFLETNNKEVDIKKQLVILQKKMQSLQQENGQLKKRITELEQLKDRDDIAQYKQTNQIANLITVDTTPGAASMSSSTPTSPPQQNGTQATPFFNSTQEPTQPLVGQQQKPTLALFSTSQNGQVSQSRSSPQTTTPILSPPPQSGTRSRGTSLRETTPTTPTSSSVTSPSPTSPSVVDLHGMDFFGATGFSNSSFSDPFGMGEFNPSSEEIDSTINRMNEMSDIQAGFSRGLSFGHDDFRLEDLDPLNQK